MAVVQEWIDTTIQAHNDLLGPVDHYVDRACVAAPDFLLGDFTRDSNFHNLDLSSIIPLGTHQVWVRMAVRNSIVARYCQFCHPDCTANGPYAQTTIQAANVFIINDIHFAVNYNRQVAYKFYLTTWTHIYFTVAGWNQVGP